MKKMFIALSAVIALLTVSCKKEKSVTTIAANSTPKTHGAFRAGGSVYHNHNCKMPNGSAGCTCEICEIDEDCELQTDCASNATLVHFGGVLSNYYSASQIAALCENNVAISSMPERLALYAALKADNMSVEQIAGFKKISISETATLHSTDLPLGGTWSTSNSQIVAIGTSNTSGDFIGVASGNAVVTYTYVDANNNVTTETAAMTVLAPQN